MNPSGPPTPDKPGIPVVDYQPGDTTSIFLNLRVADIQACYEEWKAKSAEFVTPPIDRGARDQLLHAGPDGYLLGSASPPACCMASSRKALGGSPDRALWPSAARSGQCRTAVNTPKQASRLAQSPTRRST